MKNDLPYFSHDNDARNHPKMKALRARFGWTGYGQFWALNEMIAGAADARLDLSRKVVRASAACELGMTTDALDALLAFLSDPEECGLVNFEGGILTTDRTQEDYDHVRSERERKRGDGQVSAEKRNSSAEKSPSSAEPPRRNPTEQSRAEQKREEQQPRAREVSEAEDQVAFSAFCLRLAIDRRARNPAAMARRLSAEPDVRAQFEAERQAAKGERSARTATPPPSSPCTCGGKLKSVGGPVAQCVDCGTWHHYDAAFDVWLPDKTDAFADSG